MKAFLGAVSTIALALTVACSQSDAGITTAVKAKLAADDMIKAYKVDVDTQNRVVTLSGDVETSAQREHAIMIARNTRGVRDVVDRLQVTPTEATSGVSPGATRGERLETDVKRDAEATGGAIERGAKATGSAVERGAEATGGAIERGAKATGNAVERGVKKTGDVLETGAEKTVEGVKEGAEKTKEGAEKVGKGVKKVFGGDDD